MNNETISPDKIDISREENSSEIILPQIFRTIEADLLGMLYHVLGNIEDARDALQDTFIRCWKHRDSLYEIQNIRAWIFKIAYNIARDVKKSAWQKRRQALLDDENGILSHEPKADDAMIRSEELKQFQKAIQSLDNEEKEVFLLRQNGELTFEQIAQTLNIPLGTAKTRMRRAVMKLHGILEE
ncbi:MAG: sigma-70 family RNA polymerase sigma factor [Planctomycetaceae bacterium]|jgi:RNA polymerase sigma-70 factor (ECF subfamily)|nr:sigma-70 family RNA polymerase sigma factor [Planctomycetaceae bacterium]